MIDMHIENYHITTDARNYVVTYSHEKDGKTIEGAARFYNSLPLAFQAIAKDMLKKGEGAITTIDAYVEKCKQQRILATGQRLKVMRGQNEKNNRFRVARVYG